MKICDVFLGGPQEEYAPIPFYKTKIKDALPEMKMFDPFAPEYAEIQKQGKWWGNNLIGLNNSQSMIAMVPVFPMPSLGPETGIFWSLNHTDVMQPLPQLIVIWSDSVKPEWGKEMLKKMGIVVSTVDEAVQALKNYFQTIERR
ncbi:MAG: hypothetical protein Q8N90_01005 [bacterium]|nr:hypothetical protein [bacterium]